MLVCSWLTKPFQRRRTCLHCIRDLEMEMLCGKGFPNSLPLLHSELWILIFLSPDAVSCLLKKIWSIVYTACVGTFLFQNVSFILKMLVLTCCIQYHPSAFCLSTLNTLHELSSFGGPSTWLHPRSSLMWLLSFLCHWNFFCTWSLLVFLLLFLCFCGLFTKGSLTFPCWNIIGDSTALSHFLHSISLGKLGCYLYGFWLLSSDRPL